MKPILKILIFFIFTLPVFGSEIDIPVSIQVPIFNKIFALERNLVKKVEKKDELNIAVIYQNKYRKSLNSYNSIVEQYNKYNTFQDKKISITPVRFETLEKLNESLKDNNIDVVIIAPLRAVGLSEISRITQQLKILSLSLVADYVKEGISVGLEKQGEKAKIIINLKSARKEGADFSSHLLRIVKIIE